MAQRRRDLPSYDEETREQALELADEVGTAEAARQLEIPEGTVKSWRSRAGRVSPPKGSDPVDWAAQRETVAAASWEVVQQAIAQAKRHLDAGESSKAQSAMVTAGIAADKAGALLRAVDEYHASNVRLSEAQGQLISAVLRAALVDLGAEEAGRGLVGHYVRQAAEEGTVVERSAEGASKAREILERAVLRRVGDDDLVAEVRRRGLTVAPPVAAIGSGERDGDEDAERVGGLRRADVDAVLVEEGAAEQLPADEGLVRISEY